VNIGAGSHDLRSFIGDHIAQKNGTFALLWRIEKGMISVSLRGAPCFDVSGIAERFGGGRHRGASAFKVPLGTGQADQFWEHWRVTPQGRQSS